MGHLVLRKEIGVDISTCKSSLKTIAIDIHGVYTSVYIYSYMIWIIMCMYILYI